MTAFLEARSAGATPRHAVLVGLRLHALRARPYGGADPIIAPLWAELARLRSTRDETGRALLDGWRDAVRRDALAVDAKRAADAYQAAQDAAGWRLSLAADPACRLWTVKELDRYASRHAPGGLTPDGRIRIAGQWQRLTDHVAVTTRRGDVAHDGERWRSEAPETVRLIGCWLAHRGAGLSPAEASRAVVDANPGVTDHALRKMRSRLARRLRAA